MAAKPGSSFPSFGSTPDLIFLNYARVDRARVEPIAAALRARGASVWYDAGLAAGGSVYVESVQRALRRTGVMLVFVSAAAVGSAWVADELRAYRSLMAREPGRHLLAIHLDKTRAPLSLAGVGAVDAHDAKPATIVNLIANALGDATLLPMQPVTTAAPHMSAGLQTPPATTPQEPFMHQPQTRAGAQVASGQVFVSYDRVDRERVQSLVTALRERGVPVWDDGGIAHGGAGYVETVRAALERSRTLLVAVSAASVASPWVADEVRAFQSHKARDTGRALIALHLDRTPAPLGLNGAKAVDAQSLMSNDAARLIVDLLPVSGAIAAISDTTVEPPVTATPLSSSVIEVAPIAVEAAPEVAETLTAEEAPELAAIVETGAAPEAAVSSFEAPAAEVLSAVAEAPVAEAAPFAPPPVEDAAPLVVEAATEGAPLEPAPLSVAHMLETAPALKTAAPAAETTPATFAPGVGAQPVEDAPLEATPIETMPVTPEPMAATTPTLTARPTDEAAQAEAAAALAAAELLAAKFAAKPGAASQATPAEWNRAIGPAVLVIVVLIALAFIVWANAGYPLPL